MERRRVVFGHGRADRWWASQRISSLTPRRLRGMPYFRGRSRGAQVGDAGEEGDPTVPPAVTFTPREIQVLGERRPQNSLQSPSVTGQPSAVSKGLGEGRKSASQLQHLLNKVSMRILLTVLC